MGHSCSILVTIETDPTRYHGEHALKPALPDRAASEQLLAHLVTDLERTFPDIRDFSIAMPGALYDQTQVLRPGFPLFGSLERLLAATRQEDPSIRAVDIAGAGAEANVLRPDPRIPPGLLQNLPLLVAGDPGRIAPMAEAMEHRFLEEGQLSAHSAKALEAHFGVAVQHARFMTLTDLMAMLKLQLEHFGFAALWRLLEAALVEDHESFEVEGRDRQRFEFADGMVTGRFESFDHWACERGASVKDAELEESYVAWTREYRQFVTTLQAHAVPLTHDPAWPGGAVIERDYLIEQSINDEFPATAAEVTEQGSREVGVIAVTVIEEGRQMNYYPLSASGLNSLHRALRRRGLGPGGFAYPGRLVHDPASRRLVPDPQAHDPK